LELVGEGPVGWVYRAEDREVGGEVALKLIRPRLLQTRDEKSQFLTSVRTGRQFSHPQLARVYEEGEHGDFLFFTAPHLGGRNLRSVLELKVQAGQTFPIREALPLLGQIASALAAAHAVGVHGDLKPENIFLLPDALKLTDFGLALGIPREPFLKAQRGFRHEAYFSPEYVAGTELDPRADVYALGVLLGEMLGNVIPEGSIPSLRHANPNLPLAVNGLYRRALNESRDARPETPGELISELTQLVENLEKASFDFPPAPLPLVGEPPPVERAPLPPPVPETAVRQETELVAEDELVKQLEPAVPRERRTTAQWPGSELPTLERPLTPAYRSRQHRRVRRTQSVSTLILIALAGLTLGVAGGWLLLERMRTRTPQGPVADPPSSSVAPRAEPPVRALAQRPPRADPAEPAQPSGEEASEEPQASEASESTAAEASGAAPERAVEAAPPPVRAGRTNAVEDAFRSVPGAPGESPETSQVLPPAPAAPESAREPGPLDNADELISYLEGTKADADARAAKAASQPEP
jgi:serine/threonine protein kinase